MGNSIPQPVNSNTAANTVAETRHEDTAESIEDESIEDEWMETQWKTDKWMEERCAEIVYEYQSKHGLKISVLIAPKGGEPVYDISNYQCLEKRSATHDSAEYQIWIGGKGKIVNSGSRGSYNWVCKGYDHRQEDNVMHIGEKYGEYNMKQYQFVSITYDTNNGLCSDKKETFPLRSMYYNNASATTKQHKFRINQHVMAESHFQHISGESFQWNKKIRIAFPKIIAEDQMSSILTVQRDIVWGAATQETVLFTKIFCCSVPPNTKTICKAKVSKGLWTVPYSLKFRIGGKEYVDEGAWKGMSACDLRVELKECASTINLFRDSVIKATQEALRDNELNQTKDV